MDTVSSQGVVQSDPQNIADPKGVHTRSTFTDKDLGYSFYATLPFGEVRPFTFFESVPDDKNIRAQFLSQVQSYTLKAPLMQSIHMKKLLVQVPRESILPFNWDKFFKNPVIGEDCPADCGTSVLGFWQLASGLCSTLQDNLEDVDEQTTQNWDEALTNIFKYLIVCEMFYSDGNLLKHCGISGRPWCYSVDTDLSHLSVDNVFDRFLSLFNQWLRDQDYLIFTDSGGTNYQVRYAVDSSRVQFNKVINVREMLSLMREDLNFELSIHISSGDTSFSDFYNNVRTATWFTLVFVEDPASSQDDLVSVDLKRLWAYQLANAHFLTNDSVDYVFTAELFRQYIADLVQDVNGDSFLMFSVNGFKYQYDFLSAKYFSSISDDIYQNAFAASPASFAYLCALFSFKRSLRYLDYFTGSKTHPLAVGDVNVGVNNNLVNVVDTQAKTFLARFLNVINRVGMRNYVEGVFNVRQAPDWHNPQYLVKIDDIVSPQNVENTGSDQWSRANSVTSLLHGNSDRFAFQMDFDRSSVVVGLVWFDIDRVYSMATERQNLHYDRFDEFQPFMQYTGDQALMRVELGTPIATRSAGDVAATAPFGYKLRNCEYKERYDQCAGGFCNESLETYIFKADVLETSAIQNQSPSFIRSFPSELDRFYLSLTGYSLATYFHFIVKFTNLYSGSRPMAYAPTLL